MERKRNNRVYVYMTDDELKAFKNRQTESGLKTAQSYAIQALLNGKVTSAEEVAAIQQTNRELAAQSLILRNLGNNVNQMAKYCNTVKDVDRDILIDVQTKVDEMKERMEQVWRLVRFADMEKRRKP